VVKVKIEPSLYDRAKRAAEAAGYSSVEEFIADCVEKEIQRLKVEEQEDQVSDQLRGLGYIE
jgi:metal-responsive CopG/Arc/MetJ family transcriptional regulator